MRKKVLFLEDAFDLQLCLKSPSYIGNAGTATSDCTREVSQKTTQAFSLGVMYFLRAIFDNIILEISTVDLAAKIGEEGV